MKNSFVHPNLVGIIGRGMGSFKLQKKLNSAFRRAHAPFICLPFAVELKHLKNVIKCMQLMDVVCLYIEGEYRRKIVRHVKKLDASAKKAGRVDLIVKKGKTFIGYHTTSPIEDGLRFMEIN